MVNACWCLLPGSAFRLLWLPALVRPFHTWCLVLPGLCDMPPFSSCFPVSCGFSGVHCVGNGAPEEWGGSGVGASCSCSACNFVVLVDASVLPPTRPALPVGSGESGIESK